MKFVSAILVDKCMDCARISDPIGFPFPFRTIISGGIAGTEQSIDTTNFIINALIIFIVIFFAAFILLELPYASFVYFKIFRFKHIALAIQRGKGILNVLALFQLQPSNNLPALRLRYLKFTILINIFLFFSVIIEFVVQYRNFDFIQLMGNYLSYAIATIPPLYLLFSLHIMKFTKTLQLMRLKIFVRSIIPSIILSLPFGISFLLSTYAFQMGEFIVLYFIYYLPLYFLALILLGQIGISIRKRQISKILPQSREK